jgi:glutathione peroxidase
MKNLLKVFFVALTSCTGQYTQPVKAQSVHDFEMQTLSGEKQKLSIYKGKTLLIVNVASKCGLTPQYAELQSLYEQLKDKGLVILGFPANNFLWQEPGSDSEIQSFCSRNYGVTFPMFSKISVKGKEMHPLYQFLTQKKHNGVLDQAVSWNFQKFLVSPEGKVITYFSPRTSVTDPVVRKIIEDNLPKK